MELDDLYFMNQALLEAEKSLEKSEVPVGAVIVVNQNKPFEERVRNLALGLLEFDLDKVQIDSKIKNLIDDYKYTEVRYER